MRADAPHRQHRLPGRRCGIHWPPTSDRRHERNRKPSDRAVDQATASGHRPDSPDRSPCAFRRWTRPQVVPPGFRPSMPKHGRTFNPSNSTECLLPPRLPSELRCSIVLNSHLLTAFGSSHQSTAPVGIQGQTAGRHIMYQKRSLCQHLVSNFVAFCRKLESSGLSGRRFMP